MRINLIVEKHGAPEGSGVYSVAVQRQRLLAGMKVSFDLNGEGDDYDLFHAETTGWSYFRTSFRHRGKLLVSAHEVPDTYLGSFVFDRVCRFFARPLLRFSYNRAATVLAVSPYVKEELQKIGVTANIEVLCNCVDREVFRPDPGQRQALRKQYGFAETDFIALGVGQLIPRKGVEHFVRVAERMPEHRFVWLGGRPFGRLHANYRGISRLVEQAPANCLFLNHIPHSQLPGYYAMADILLFPSLQECFSMVILEAGGTTLPLVLWDNPAYPAYLSPHYQKAKTTDGFVEIIRKLSSDPAEYARWSQASDQLAERYNSQDYARQLYACYTRHCPETGR